jgi:hypothetical protein
MELVKTGRRSTWEPPPTSDGMRLWLAPDARAGSGSQSGRIPTSGRDGAGGNDGGIPGLD